MFDEILKLTKEVKEKYPYLRFQQIMSIAAFHGGWKDNDLFYCSDSIILKGLKSILSDVAEI